MTAARTASATSGVPHPHPPPAGTDDDRALVARLRAGDAAAFETLFDTWYVPLCVYVARQVGVHAAAEEIVQDVFANLWMQRSALYVQNDMRVYLFGAARNRSLNWLRDRQVVGRWEQRAVHESGASGMGQGPQPVEERIHRQELSQAFDRALACLSPREREAFTLRRHGQLSTAQIARVMGISVKTVEATLTRAYKALRVELAPLL